MATTPTKAINKLTNYFELQNSDFGSLELKEKNDQFMTDGVSKDEKFAEALGFWNSGKWKSSPEQSKMAASLFAEAARFGHPGGMYYLAYCYRLGIGVTRCMQTSFQYIQKADRLRHPNSVYMLALYYFHGWGVEKDARMAYLNFMKAAFLDVDAAKFYLGVCFEHGFGIALNLNFASEWYLKAEGSSQPEIQKDARNALASIEKKIKILKQNLTNVNKNAENISNDALLRECQIIYKSLITHTFDLTKVPHAHTLLTKSLSLGYRPALFYLGHIYEYGIGIERNLEMAKGYYESSSNLGVALAKIRLGDLNLEAFKRSNDRKSLANEAFNYYKGAADLKEDLAYCRLAECYQNGYGCTSDLPKAKNYYEKAENSNNPNVVAVARAALKSIKISEFNAKIKNNGPAPMDTTDKDPLHYQLTENTEMDIKEDMDDSDSEERNAIDRLNGQKSPNTSENLYTGENGVDDWDEEYESEKIRNLFLYSFKETRENFLKNDHFQNNTRAKPRGNT